MSGDASLADLFERASLVERYRAHDGRRCVHPLLRLAKRIVVQPSGCWETGKVTPDNGYVLVSLPNGIMRGAHKFVFEAVCGPMPPGLVLDHLCRNRACINPAHLEPVSQSENVRRGDSPEITRARHAEKDHCPHGHPYSGSNLIVRPGGHRACRACHRERNRAYKRRLAGRFCEAA